MNKKLKGYTLIEIIVVIAIIGFIASTAMYFYNDARVKSRDVKRLADIQAIAKALGLYYDDYNAYPPSDWYLNEDCNLGWVRISTVLSDYLNPIPDDPNNNIAGNHGCYLMRTVNNGYFILMGPENKNLLNDDMECYPPDPLWYCLGDDWN